MSNEIPLIPPIPQGMRDAALRGTLVPFVGAGASVLGGCPTWGKLADDTHTKLCARVFGHLAKDGALPTDWLAANIAGLSRADGDIDTLMQRLAGVRIWSYIAARADWIDFVIRAPNSDLGAIARFARDAANLHGAVGDLADFQFEQSPDEIWMAA